MFLKNISIVFKIRRSKVTDYAALSDGHTLPDGANGRVPDSNNLCPFVPVRIRFLSVPHA